jgi:MFS family permease
MYGAAVRQPNILRVYAATLVLGCAYGISIALTALVLDAHHFSKHDIGTLAAIFASGIVIVSLPVGGLIRRISARTTLKIAIVGYAIAVAAFPWPHDYWSIAAIRFVDGACSVGIWVSCETILLAQAEKARKAFITSIYAIAMSIGYVVGPIVARVVTSFVSEAQAMPAAFGTSGVIALCSLVFVWGLDRDAHVHVEGTPDVMLEKGEASSSSAETEGNPSHAELSMGAVFWKIKTSCFATFSYGYFQASVVLFLPLYLMSEKNITKPQTILIPAFFAAGMLLFSNFAGRIGDRVGHLAVMRVLSTLGGMMILGFIFLNGFSPMCIAVFIAGATLASLSPLSIALQGIVVEPRDYSRANSIYNALYAAGMLLGPPISSVIFEKWKGAAMLYHLAAMWAVFVVFTIVFASDDPARKISAPLRGAAGARTVTGN